MKHITNQKMHHVNTHLVLDLIRRSACLTRSSVVKQTGMTMASVSNIVNELSELGYIECTEAGASAGGRKPMLLRLKPDAEYAVGMEMTASHILCMVGDLQAKERAHSIRPVSAGANRNITIDLMVDTVRAVVDASGLEKSRISGLGLAMPGPCDYERGIVLNPPNFPDWKQVPIAEILSERLGMKVCMAKETACDGLAEYWFGGAVDRERIFVLHVGSIGIGGAFVDGGRVFSNGARETMDIGHNTVEMDGFPCPCGSRGCLEAQASGVAALRYARQYAHMDATGAAYTCLEDVLRGVETGDPACVRAIERCADYLCMALRNVIALLAPDRIFCGGSFAERCPRLVEAVAERLHRVSYPDCSAISLEPFSFGQRNGAVGALALVLGRRGE